MNILFILETYISANSNLKDAISGNAIHSSTDNELRGRGQRRKKKSTRYEDDYEAELQDDGICPPRRKLVRKEIDLQLDRAESIVENHRLKRQPSTQLSKDQNIGLKGMLN